MAEETLNRPASGPQPSDKWIPWYFVLFFVVVAAVNAVFIVYAVDSFTGVTQDNAYEKGLAYNDTLAAQRAQDALGWQAELTSEITGPLGADLHLVLSDADGRPLSGAIVTAALIRPTSAGHDFTHNLNETSPAGTYTATLAFPLPGQWDVHLDVRHDGHTFRQTRRIYLKE